jgi:hypothetical protein
MGIKNRKGEMLKSWFCVARMVDSLNLPYLTKRLDFGGIQHLGFVRDPPIKPTESIGARAEEYLSIWADELQRATSGRCSQY